MHSPVKSEPMLINFQAAILFATPASPFFFDSEMNLIKISPAIQS
jgi:hypothetical protein